jgi:8-hydroxy-5-deazaflavin:NADPH oxidoreductase
MKQQQVRKPLPVTENGTGLVEARLVGARRDTQGFHAAPMMTASQTPPLDGLVIAILGGTGEQGRGLARRFAMAGHPVIIGSRSYDRARAIAQEIGHGICGLANRDATREADLVIVTVPYEGHSELLVGLAAELAGKIVVDCVNPLGFDQGGVK